MILGWLGDPFLHLLVIGAIVLAIGSRITSQANRPEAASEEHCDSCQTYHDVKRVCPQLISAPTYALQRR